MIIISNIFEYFGVEKMSFIHKITASCLALGLVLTATGAQAAEQTSNAGSILFRIENIKPITNDKELIEQCSFIVTAYNRMDKSVKTAELALSWVDNVSAKYVIKEGEVVAVKGKEAETTVTSSITLTDIAPHTQKSFEQKVSTDKCFLLLDNLTYNTVNCFTDSDNIVMKDSKLVGTGDCTDKFNYIDSKNPEYYSEFKDVPESVLKQQAEEEKNRDLNKINASHSDILLENEKTNDILKQIT